MRTKILFLILAVVMGGAIVGPATRADGLLPVEVSIVVAPSAVYMASQGTWVTVHAEISYSAVAGASVTLNDIPVKATFADSRGELVAKFALDDVKEILVPGTMELTLCGETRAGVPFMGTDDIRVMAAKTK